MFLRPPLSRDVGVLRVSGSRQECVRQGLQEPLRPIRDRMTIQNELLALDIFRLSYVCTLVIALV